LTDISTPNPANTAKREVRAFFLNGGHGFSPGSCRLGQRSSSGRFTPVA
jgi:hypothetical protein